MIRLPCAAMRRTSHGFAIPTDLIDAHGPAVGAIGVAVYAVLPCDADPQTGACRLDPPGIARVLGLTPATVTTALQRLAAAGVITTEEHGSDTPPGMPP